MRRSLTRRNVLGTAMAGGGLVLAGRMGGRIALGAATEGWPGLPPVKIYTVYVCSKRPAWPKPELDVKAEVSKFETCLTDVERRLGDVKFVGGEVIYTEAEADKVVANLRGTAGVLIIHLAIGAPKLMAPIVDAGLPTVVFSQPFSGHGWMDVRRWRNAGKKVLLLTTSDYNEIGRAVELLRVPGHMRQTRIIAQGCAGSAPARDPKKIKDGLGAEVVPVGLRRIRETYATVDAKAAETLADRWIREAAKVVEPTRDDLVKAARLYFAMQKIMVKERAQAITLNCLGGFPLRELGHPCLGFSDLNDQGRVGACEADMDSTLTMLMFGYAFGVPGFITDPLFDTSKNVVIHAHCTCAKKMDGPAGETAPHLIRNHRDSNTGAALEVQMRLGQAITCAKLINLDTMLISTGKITEITDYDDRGCRTQITTEVADASKMLERWGSDGLEGWMPELHRVVFYGDHMKRVGQLATLMGLKIYPEA